MKNLYVDVRTMSSKPSGVGLYLFHLLKELVKCEKITITMITDVIVSNEIKYFLDKKISILVYGKQIYKSSAVIRYFKFVEKILRVYQPEFFWEPNNLIPVIIRGYRGNIVLTIHDIFPITMPQYSSIIYQIYFRIGLKKSIRQSRKVIYDSRETLENVKRYYPEVLEKQNYVSYMIVPKLKVGIIEDKNFFLYIGNMEKRKGVDLLLKAYYSYRLDGGKKELYLIGKMREKEIELLLEEIQQHIKGINFLGYLAEEDKNNILSQCTCFVFPSKAEGFGIPPIEAMNYKKPIILSDLSIFKEVIGDSVNYFKLVKEETEQVQNLKKLMVSYDETKIVKYDEVIEKYQPENIVTQLYEFIMYT